MGGAGFLVSANRILTKMLMDDQRANTLIFFAVSVGMVALCFCLHQAVRRTDFVQFYLTLCRESRKITLEPTEDAGLVLYGLLQLIYSVAKRERCVDTSVIREVASHYTVL
ncbi:hypothetical protein J6590_087803 [Homalodisca vitripennis]|nr:hypothetical protein J6590_087803 [Homalodisca vitripennis]